MHLISTIAGLLSLCGIASMRMFAPVFLFGLICRYMPDCSWCPAEILEIAKTCPPFLTSDFGLLVFGTLGVLEVIANWDDTVKEMLSETNIETYVKPFVAALITYSVCTPEQAEVLSAVINGVPGVAPAASDPAVVNAVAEEAATAAASSSSGFSFSALLSGLFSWGGTFSLCKVRAGIVAAVREMDPDNSLRLNSLLTLIEEGSWLALLPLLLVFPILALLLLLTFGFFGWLLSRPLKALAAKRRAHWDAVGREGMLRQVSTRAIIIFILGVFLSSVPVFGYLATVLSLNIFVFGVMGMYEKRSFRFLVRLLMRFIKLTIFLFALCFSWIPFMGIVLLVPYLISYLIRVQRLKQTVQGGEE